MAQLIFGLIIFLGVHALQTLAPAQRERLINTYGPLPYKAAYSVLSLFGLIVLIGGYAIARQEPILLWAPPTFLSHAASLFTLLAFILLVAAYIPRNLFKRKLKHPMVLGVKLWAFAHLLANGGLHDLILFGGFLVWSILVFRSSRRRPLQEGGNTSAASVPLTLLTLLVGMGAWAWFAFVGHAWLIGVAPFVMPAAQ
ncbi:MAG: NnrU family protein [Burkholderiaceae bacterium]